MVGWASVGRGAMGAALAALLGAAAMPATARGAEPAEEPQESCVRCHSSPDFLVTNRKLYEYFQDWQRSVHAQEGVTCSDCHGGNPDAPDEAGAHAAEVGGADEPRSAVSFQNVPETCGGCHEANYRAYRESDHFDHLVRKKQDKRGPNCVTCHGSLNVEVLNVNTVGATCQKCHNDETENHPDIPEKAKKILNQFLSIHRYYRYIGRRADPDEAKGFFREADRRIKKVSEVWHTFDLPRVEKETQALVDFMRAKRAEIRAKAGAAPDLEDEKATP